MAILLYWILPYQYVSIQYSIVPITEMYSAVPFLALSWHCGVSVVVTLPFSHFPKSYWLMSNRMANSCKVCKSHANTDELKRQYKMWCMQQLRQNIFFHIGFCIENEDYIILQYLHGTHWPARQTQAYSSTASSPTCQRACLELAVMWLTAFSGIDPLPPASRWWPPTQRWEWWLVVRLPSSVITSIPSHLLRWFTSLFFFKAIWPSGQQSLLQRLGNERSPCMPWQCYKFSRPNSCSPWRAGPSLQTLSKNWVRWQALRWWQ